MQILAYILEFGMAWYRLTCPFSLDGKHGVTAHAWWDVNADKCGIIGGAGGGPGGAAAPSCNRTWYTTQTGHITQHCSRYQPYQLSGTAVKLLLHSNTGQVLLKKHYFTPFSSAVSCRNLWCN